ncbi:MAG: hypothetical protein C0473_00385 [Cyanobacteria bacterium DS3.002]|nr:hypothetical protein [Cyanobacteria bacterium DS3.002]MBA4050258.1 hypothetical protein [Cyanobacteria bacterium DS2.008]
MGKLIDLEDEQIVNRIDCNATTDEKIRQLQELSRENEPGVKKFLAKIDRKYGTESKVSHKEPEKIAEKASRPAIKDIKKWHDVEHIRDSFRFKTVLNDIEDLPRIAEDLKETGIEVIKTDTDKVLSPGFWGWRIAALDLKMPNGQLVEYYLPVKEIEEAKKAGNHQLFEKWRNVDIQKLTPEQENQYLNDTDESKETYDDAWQKYLDRTKQKPEKIREVLAKTEKVFERTKTVEIKEKTESPKPSRLREKIREQKPKSKEDDLLR